MARSATALSLVTLLAACGAPIDGDVDNAGDECVEIEADDAGDVWTNNKATGPEGVNLYWDEEVLRPDLVPDHEPRYCRQMDDPRPW